MLRNRRKPSGLTLIELVLAVSLMGFVILTAVNIEIVAHRFFSESDKEGQLQVKLAVAMERISKDVLLAHGGPGNVGVMLNGDVLEVRIDALSGGTYTPANYDDDVWVRYWSSADDRILSCRYSVGSPCEPVEVVATGGIFDLLFDLYQAGIIRPYMDISITGTTVDTPPIAVTLVNRIFFRSQSHILP